MLSRSYGDVDGRFKDGAAVYLMPGEKPRQSLPFPTSTDCPKCGSHGWAENTGEVFHCLYCGTWLFRDPPIPWRRDNNKILCHKHPRRREITVTCQRCGKDFGTHNHNGMVKFCPDCREIARAEHQRVTDRERKARRKKERLAVRSDDATAGRVETVVATNQSQTKEEATT